MKAMSHGRIFLSALALGALGCAGVMSFASAAEPAGAPAAASLAAEQAIVFGVEDARFQAQVEQNLAGLSAAIADDALYIHANGVTQDKATFLADVEAGRSRYRKIEATDRSAAIMGDVAVTHAQLALHVGVDKVIAARTTGVYVRRDGKWLVLSWQSTPVQGEVSQSSRP